MAVACAGRTGAVPTRGRHLRDERRVPASGGSLAAGTVVDGYIECPWHYALFDIRTGAADGAITSQPLRTFPTRVEDDVIYVDLPMAEERMP